MGTYFSVEHNECVSCWLGSYQDQEGQLECKSCPEGSSTAYLHSRSVTECKGKIAFMPVSHPACLNLTQSDAFPGQCKPGTHSPNGLEICESCPMGHYQPGYAARDCLNCPEETSTVTRGAVDKAECGGDAV